MTGTGHRVAVSGVRDWTRTHRLLLALLALAALVRVAFEIAYWPALLFSDSWTYLDVAFSPHFSTTRPAGYSAVIAVLSLPGRSLGTLTALQHLAGLVTGALCYLLVERLGAPRWASIAVAVIALFDAYAIVLEQHVLAEAFFALAVTASAYLALAHRDKPLALAASGVLLGGAATMRTVGVFAIPVWILFVFLSGWGRPRLIALACAAVVAPVLAYSAAHAAAAGTFGMTKANGWFLYGRVAEIADCSTMEVADEARPLCESTDANRDRGAVFYLWSDESPARRAFGGDMDPRSNAILGRFARDTIADRPGEYAGVVARDFVRFFEPGTGSIGYSDSAVVASTQPERRWLASGGATRTRFFPDFEPQVRAPAGALATYQDAVHLPRWLLGLCSLAGIGALLLALLPRFRGRMRDPAALLLLTLVPLAMLAGAVATSEFVLRYMVPVAPLLACAGVVAYAELRRAFLTA